MSLTTFSGHLISIDATHILRETHAAHMSGDIGPDRYHEICARHFCQRSLDEWGVPA